MKGKLRDTQFFKGDRIPVSYRQQGQVVEIAEEENHPIYGTRYKIRDGGGQWFEKNCFEWVGED